jgi:hypothetical protein
MWGTWHLVREGEDELLLFSKWSGLGKNPFSYSFIRC